MKIEDLRNQLDSILGEHGLISKLMIVKVHYVEMMNEIDKQYGL